jgi:hypothetical protein
MYVTPALLNSVDWDVLVETAKWARAHAYILIDTHWVGGDPAKLEPYGWASWSPEKALLVLRNPSDKEQAMAIDPSVVFELPAVFTGEFQARSPWRKDRDKKLLIFKSGKPLDVILGPFEVLTLEVSRAQ